MSEQPAVSTERVSSADELAAQSRTLRNSLIGLAVFFALVAALLLGVPGLREAARRISDADPSWIAAGVAFELLSCVGYVVLFGLVFEKLGRSLSSRLSLSELAVNSAVSVGVSRASRWARGCCAARASRWSGSRSARC
jgi:uncharacterized membrane protein YbhN (UPF0104 family)